MAQIGQNYSLSAASEIPQGAVAVQNFTKTTHHDPYPAIDTRGSPGWDCKGKAMLITGANSGVGRAVVQSYARAGASHIGLGVRRDVSELVDAVKAAAVQGGHPEPTVTVLLMDLEDRASVGAAAEQLEREWGRLDILISNADFLPPEEPLLESDETDYWRAWEINIRGTYWNCQGLLALAAALRRRQDLHRH